VEQPTNIQGESQLSYRGWGVVTAAFFGVMTGYAVLIPYTFGFFVKPLQSRFAWRRDQISIAFGCAAITAALSSPVVGRLLDKYGAKRTILTCLTVFGLTFASLSLLTSQLVHLYIVFVLLGLAGNGTTQLAYSRTVSAWFFQRRGLALAITSAGAGAGAFIVPLLTELLLQLYGWRVTYAVLGILVLIVAIPLTALLVQEKSGMPYATGNDNSRADLLAFALRTKPFLLLVLSIFFYSVTVNGIVTHLSALLTDRNLSLHVSAMAASVLGACGLLGRLLTGYLLDRYFAPRVSLILFLTTVVGVFLLSIPSLPSSFIAAALIGFAIGGESDVTPYTLSRYFSLLNFSTLYGFAWTAFGIGAAVGPFLMGRMYVSTGGYQARGIQLLGTSSLASALLMLWMPRYPKFGDG
jgi:MFS family permease